MVSIVNNTLNMLIHIIDQICWLCYYLDRFYQQKQTTKNLSIP